MDMGVPPLKRIKEGGEEWIWVDRIYSLYSFPPIVHSWVDPPLFSLRTVQSSGYGWTGLKRIKEGGEEWTPGWTGFILFKEGGEEWIWVDSSPPSFILFNPVHPYPLLSPLLHSL